MRLLRAATSLCLLLTCAAAASAQDQARWTEAVPPEEELALWRSINQAVNAGDWLGAAQTADRHRGAPDETLVQWQGFFYSWVGRSDLVAALEEQGLLTRPPLCEPAAGLQQRDALETIVEAAADHQAIIIQELHWESQHRLLMSELLPRLRELGFSVFAAEDFQADPAIYESADYYPGGVVDFHSTHEPVFADAVRQAIALGYRLVRYEATFPPPADVPPQRFQAYRSEQQAKNLYERIFVEDPDAKALIYLGVGWGREAPNPQFPGDIPMVVQLKEMAGIDPLTVDQIGCRLPDPQDGSGAVIAFLPDGAGAVQGHPPGSFDMQIRYGSDSYEPTGRANWLSILGRKPVAVPEQLRLAGEATVIEARRASDPEDATPFDRLYLAAGETLPLMLAPGAYRVSASDGEAVTVSVD